MVLISIEVNADMGIVLVKNCSHKNGYNPYRVDEGIKVILLKAKRGIIGYYPCRVSEMKVSYC